MMKKLFRLAARQPAPEIEVRDEVEAHLAHKVDALVAGGMPPEAARAEALRQFGSRAAIEQETRVEAEAGSRRRRWLDQSSAWRMDLRVALRSLVRSPGYTVLASVVLALGIGASLAVLAVADRMLFRPLPYSAADRLVLMLETGADGSIQLPSYPTVKDWQVQAKEFEGISYVYGTQVGLRGPEGVEAVTTAFVSPEFFPVMGAKPILGRTLTAADDAEGTRVAVLSYPLWQRRFGSDPQIVGSTISLQQGPVTVVGVLPLGFRFPEWGDMYMPLRSLEAGDRAALELRGNHADSRVVGRLKPAVSLAGAGAALKLIAERLAREYPTEQGLWTGVTLLPIRDYVTNAATFSQRGAPNAVQTVVIFSGAIGLVLLIACANVACLTLVRGQARSRELAIRASIGAGRRHLIRLLLIESGIVAGIGGALGIVLASQLIRGLQRAAPDLLPRLDEVRIDPRFVLLTVGLAALSAVLTGLIPALRTTSSLGGELVAGGGFQGSGSRRRTRAQRGLVVLQIGLAVTLLVGATVLIESFVRVLRTPIGFEPDRLLNLWINPDPEKYRTADAQLEFYRRMLEVIQRVPGVVSAAVTNHSPITGASLPSRLVVEGFTAPDRTQEPTANFRTVSPEYFRTMGIPVRQGRVYAEADLAKPNGGLVVNESLARRYWPNQNPIGHRITVFKSARWLPDFGEPISGTVIGVVGDVRHYGAEGAVPDEVYIPYTWNAWRWTSVVVRSRDDPDALIDPIRRAMLSVDPDLPVARGSERNITSFSEILAASRGPRRLLTLVAGALAGAALVLAVVGLYGVMAYIVGLRRREIAIRGALGATRAQVRRMMLWQGLGLAAVGVVLGLATAVTGASLLQSLVFGVQVRDLAAFAVVPALLLGVAAAAVYLPARRATRIEPMEVLRGE